MQHSDGAVRPAGARPTSAAHADRAWQHAGKVGAGERAAGGRRGQGTPFVVDRRSAAGSSGVSASSLWPLLPHQTCYGTRGASLDLQPARGLKPARQAASRRCLVREQTLKFLYTHTCGATQSRSRPTLRRPRQRDAARAAPGPAHRAGRCCCDLSSNGVRGTHSRIGCTARGAWAATEHRRRAHAGGAQVKPGQTRLRMGCASCCMSGVCACEAVQAGKQGCCLRCRGSLCTAGRVRALGAPAQTRARSRAN